MKTIKFEVRSRRRAIEFLSDHPWAAISVSTDDNFPNLSEENRIDLLRLKFKDICDPMSQEAFTKKQASQILDFYKDVSPKINFLLIHCDAGMSRSPAIAAALEYITYGEASQSKYFGVHKYIPNNLVFQTILECYYGESIGVLIAKRFETKEEIHDEPWSCLE